MTIPLRDLDAQVLRYLVADETLTYPPTTLPGVFGGAAIVLAGGTYGPGCLTAFDVSREFGLNPAAAHAALTRLRRRGLVGPSLVRLDAPPDLDWSHRLSPVILVALRKNGPQTETTLAQICDTTRTGAWKAAMGELYGCGAISRPSMIYVSEAGRQYIAEEDKGQ